MLKNRDKVHQKENISYWRVRNFSVLAGFNAIEMMVALAISAVFLLGTFSAVHLLIEKNQGTVIANRLVSAINFARTEAIARGELMIFCGSSDHQHCDGYWNSGQIVVTESGNLLRVFNALKSGKLFWRSSLGWNDRLVLMPSGFTQGQRGSFYYCPTDDKLGFIKVIVVEQTGRTRIETERKTNNCP